MKISVMTALSAALMAICSCSSDPRPKEKTIHARTSTVSPRLPSGVVSVKGGQPVQVSAAGAASCSETTADMSASALSYTNGLRARHGLAPLKANRSLQLAARAHACDMASFGWMSHRGSHSAGPAERVKAVGYRPRITAENIAAGNFDLNRTLTEWSRSPNHRNNILLPSISEFGIGHALSADGKSHFWTAVYADPAG